MVRRCLGGIGLALFSGLVIFLVGGRSSAQAAPMPAVSSVNVVNLTSAPIPTAPQGVTAVAGTLNLAMGTTVGVTNSPATPLFVQLPLPNSRAFQQTVSLLIPINSRSNTVSFISPSGGTRVVIEEVSLAITDNSTFFIGKIQTSVAGVTADHFLPSFGAGVVRPLTTMEPRRIYADPQSIITVTFESPASGAYVLTQVWVTVSGLVE